MDEKYAAKMFKVRQSMKKQVKLDTITEVNERSSTMTDGLTDTMRMVINESNGTNS